MQIYFRSCMANSKGKFKLLCAKLSASSLKYIESDVRSHFVSSVNSWTDTNKYTSVVVVRWIKRRRKTAYEEAARQTDAPTSCLRPLFDKPIGLRTRVRGTNRNSCLCSPVVSFFVRCFYLTNVRNRSKQIEMAGWNIYSASHPSLLQESFGVV